MTTLTKEDLNLILVALAAFSILCENNIREMNNLAIIYPEKADQCARNVAASRSLKAEADDLRKRI